jgi:hypothetical protein
VALDDVKRAPTERRGDQIAIGRFMFVLHRHPKTCGCVGAAISAGPADPGDPLFSASDTEALRRAGMWGTIVGNVLLPCADADVLMAADLREHVHPTEKCRGRIDQRASPLEGIRRDAVNPAVRGGGLEVCQQAPGELWLGGLGGIGGWFGQPRGLGPLGLLASFFPTIPGAELRIGLIEDKAHGKRDVRRHQAEQDQALAPEVAPAFFVTQFLEIGELVGRL